MNPLSRRSIGPGTSNPPVLGILRSWLVRNSTASSIPVGELNGCPPLGYYFHPACSPNPRNVSGRTLLFSTKTRNYRRHNYQSNTGVFRTTLLLLGAPPELSMSLVTSFQQATSRERQQARQAKKSPKSLGLL